MNYLVDISYDGCNYHGWAKQKNNESVQQTIENCLSRIYQQKINIIGSGRTDTGVHAIHQYFSFCENKVNLTPVKLIKALNSQLPYDIRINKIKTMNNSFNARYDAKSKTYLYVINIGKFDIFKNRYLLNYNKPIDLVLWKKAIKLFIGNHNFDDIYCSSPNFRKNSFSLYARKWPLHDNWCYSFFNCDIFWSAC